jgi:type IV pilus assembly protein PilV
MLMKTRASRFALASNRGVSLLEVLIALVVTSIGLLGIAKMQALAISSTRVSSMRSLISVEASSLASAIHANRLYWTGKTVGSVANTFEVDVTSGAAGGTITSSTDAALQAAVLDCTAVTCVGAPMAAYDLQQWGAALFNVMPTSTGSVICSGLPPACTITVNWTETSVGMNSATQYTNGTQAQTYTLMVQP